MDQVKIFGQLFQTFDHNPIPTSSNNVSQNQDENSILELRLGIQPYRSGHKRRLLAGVNVKDTVASKKKKSDCEKMRREKLKEHFLQLENIIDSGRHKNDKATIVINAIQALKELTSEINRLRAEHAALYQEINELTLENKELREENISLQSEVNTLGFQYNQILSFFPWASIDPSVVKAPPFSHPVSLPVASGPFPASSPPLQPIPFFGNQSGVSSISDSMFIPCLTPVIPLMDRPSALNASSSDIFSKEDIDTGSSGKNISNYGEKIDDSEDVVTDLELKMPGSTSGKSEPEDKGKQPLQDRRST